MKFSEMQYTRPDLDATGAELTALAEKLEKAENYGEAKAIFLEKEELLRHIDTLSNLVSIRHYRLSEKTAVHDPQQVAVTFRTATPNRPAMSQSACHRRS